MFNTSGNYRSPLTDWLSYQQSEIIQIIFFGVLSTGISLFGIVANMINIVIFMKQGFAYSINISLCGMAVADLCSLVVQLWVNACYTPILRNPSVPFASAEIGFITGAAVSGVFGRINGWITVVITAERCVGIALPLKVKQIFTPKRTSVAICTIYILNFFAISPIYIGVNLVPKVNPDDNRTVYGVAFDMPDLTIGVLCYILHIFIGNVSFLGIVVFTVILAVNLKKNSDWRSTIIRDNKDSSSKSRKTIKMVTLIATIFIVCTIPFALFVLAIILQPQLNVVGRYRNTFVAVMSVCFFFQNLNSSINIFLYYRMSRNYRQSFKAVFGKRIGFPEDRPI